MSFDPSSAHATKLDEGSFFQLTDARNNPIFDTDDAGSKTAVGIVLRGRNSRIGLASARANGNRRLEIARKQGSYTTTVEGQEADGTEELVALTVSWTFDTYKGRPFPCTPENARTFWSDDANMRWRRDAQDFIASEANFMGA